MSEILLNIKNMVKRFGPTVALNGVDLTVLRDGEIRGRFGKLLVRKRKGFMQEPTHRRKGY